MTTSLDQANNPYRGLPELPDDIQPFSPHELRHAIFRPDRAIDLLLVDRARLGKTLTEGVHLGTLAVVMLVSSALLSVPFGAVLGIERPFRLSFLYLGSVAICFPSLHIFSSYLGARIRLSQVLVISLVASSVASFFALGFAPILWLVRVTTSSNSGVLSWVSIALATIALVAGMAHLVRTVLDDTKLLPKRGHRFLLFLWQTLLLFVAYRLAAFLELA